MEYRADLPQTNRVKLQRTLVAVPAALCCYGLLLPENWAGLLGPFAGLLRLAERLVPAAGKFVASSSNPELMAGFMGLAVWIPPIWALYLCRWALLDLSRRDRPRLILTPPHHPAWLWLLYWGCALWAVFLLYAMPRRGFADPRDDYDRFFVALLGSRFFIAVFGAFVTAVAGLAWAAVLGFPVRLWACVSGKDKTARREA